jgi:hypothetical protein
VIWRYVSGCASARRKNISRNANGASRRKRHGAAETGARHTDLALRQADQAH